ncbi:MAG: nuclear transport factor 2 family protein [Burkholderiales bacterium]|nr:nuclear transport factor 2 family protein [Burkholderiales bacterium]
MSNMQTVKDMYEAFGRGDVPGILSRLAQDVEWEYGAHPTDLPWLQKRKGREGAANFFASLAAELNIHRFEPKTLFEQGNTVVALFDNDCTVNTTGKRILEEDGVHIFHFNNDGQVQRFRHRIDTHQQLRAYHP